MHRVLSRACCNLVANIAVLFKQEALGLASEQRMNVPGELSGNWLWRFSWDMVGGQRARPCAGPDHGGRASMEKLALAALVCFFAKSRVASDCMANIS